MPSRDQFKTAALILLLRCPSLLLGWTDHALGPLERFAVAGFALWVLLVPLLILPRWRSFFWVWLPVVPVLPAYVYVCLWFRSVPGDALVSAALTTGLPQSIEVLRGFGWKLLAIPAVVLVYVLLMRSIDGGARLSGVARQRLLAGLLLYALVGTAGRQWLGMQLALPPLFEEQAVALAFPSSLLLPASRSLAHQRRLADTATVHGRLATSAPPSLVVVLVLGESLRRDHLGLNGYARDTTPLLSALGTELLSFRDVVSTAQWTGAAVPAIVLRPLGRLNQQGPPKPPFASLNQTFGEAGFRTAWLSNQERSALSAAAEVVEHADGARDFQLRRDEVLLPLFESFLAQAGPRQFIVLHMMGSHYPYEERYGGRSRVFVPTLPPLGMAAEPGPSQKTETINSYDNTVVESDRLLRRMIDRLASEGRPALLIYTSDHGENLFDDERQVFMHARPKATRYDLDVPLLVWANAAYRAAYPEVLPALHANLARKIRHPDVFPTLLDLAFINWDGQRAGDSFASPTFVEKPRKLHDFSGAELSYEQLR